MGCCYCSCAWLMLLARMASAVRCYCRLIASDDLCQWEEISHLVWALCIENNNNISVVSVRYLFVVLCWVMQIATIAVDILFYCISPTNTIIKTILTQHQHYNNIIANTCVCLSVR